MVLISPPPPTVTPRPLYEKVEANTPLVRIYNPATRYKTQANTYRYFGPLLALSRDTCKIVPHLSRTPATHCFQTSLPSDLLHIPL